MLTPFKHAPAAAIDAKIAHPKPQGGMDVGVGPVVGLLSHAQAIKR